MVAPPLTQRWRPERRVGAMSRIGREKRDAAWTKVQDVDVEGLLSGEKDADTEDLEAMDDACEVSIILFILQSPGTHKECNSYHNIMSYVYITSLLALYNEQSYFIVRPWVFIHDTTIS